MEKHEAIYVVLSHKSKKIKEQSRLMGVYESKDAAEESYVNDIEHVYVETVATHIFYNGPDWDNAPKEANYWAVDANGSACFYEKMPSRSWYSTNWYSQASRDKFWHIGYISLQLGTDWRTTLQSRPSNKEAEYTY